MSYRTLNYGAASVYSVTAFVIGDTEVILTFSPYSITMLVYSVNSTLFFKVTAIYSTFNETNFFYFIYCFIGSKILNANSSDKDIDFGLGLIKVYRTSLYCCCFQYLLLSYIVAFMNTSNSLGNTYLDVAFILLIGFVDFNLAPCIRCVCVMCGSKSPNIFF